MLAGLIDHAALFPPASMDLDEAMEADAQARAGEHGWVIGRFVVPVDALGRLPGDGLPLSVVLRTPADAALGPEWRGSRPWRCPWTAPRPRSADLVAAYRELEPLSVEVYFELALDDSWRDSVPAVVGALAAIGARVEAALRRRRDPVARAGGARDRLLPRGARALQGHRRPSPSRCAGARSTGSST